MKFEAHGVNILLSNWHLFFFFALVLYVFPLSVSDCGGIVTGTSGVITSPNFPAAYRDEDHCAWLIEAPEGAILSVSGNSRSTVF